MRFSIISPVYVWNEYRKKGILRAAESVTKQTFRDYEHIVVNDGSPMEVRLSDFRNLKVLNKEHEERVCGLNAGFRRAKGEIFCVLDSDDEYAPDYLEKVDRYFKVWPEYKMFNFAAQYKHEDGGGWIRGAFKPKKRKVGHVVFGGGTIVSGTYVWHRDVYDDLGAFPPPEIKKIDCSAINYGKDRSLFMWTPYDFSAAAQMEFPEIRKYFMVDHVNEPHKILKELGNPWGQDYYLFYKYTRKYHSKPTEDPLYIVHPKTGAE